MRKDYDATIILTNMDELGEIQKDEYNERNPRGYRHKKKIDSAVFTNRHASCLFSLDYFGPITRRNRNYFAQFRSQLSGGKELTE